MSDLFYKVFGHYLRTETTHYIIADRTCPKTIVLEDCSDLRIIEEPCNPWLMFFHIGQKKWMKANTEKWVYQDDEAKRLWEKLLRRNNE